MLHQSVKAEDCDIFRSLSKTQTQFGSREVHHYQPYDITAPGFYSSVPYPVNTGCLHLQNAVLLPVKCKHLQGNYSMLEGEKCYACMALRDSSECQCVCFLNCAHLCFIMHTRVLLVGVCGGFYCEEQLQGLSN